MALDGTENKENTVTVLYAATSGHHFWKEK